MSSTDQFEYRFAVLPPGREQADDAPLLNVLGADGWEAVGLTPGATSVPMPGMGAKTAPALVVLLKRRLG